MRILRIAGVTYTKPVLVRMCRALGEKGFTYLSKDDLENRLNERLGKLEFQDNMRGIVIRNVPNDIEVEAQDDIVSFFLHLGIQNGILDTAHVKRIPSSTSEVFVCIPENDHSEALKNLVKTGK